MLPEILDNRFFKTAVHQCDDFVVITDAQANVIYVNPSFEKHIGFKLKEIVGKNISFVKSGLHNKTFYKSLWQELKKGNSVSKIFINKNKKGNVFYENKTITPIKNEKGKIQFYLSTSKDFTKEFNLKKEVVNQNKFIQSVLKNTDALIIGLSKDGRIILYNGACEKLLGYRFSEVSQNDIFKLLVPDEFAADFKKEFNKVLSDKKTFDKIEFHLKSRRGNFFLIKWSITLLHQEDENQSFVLLTGINITNERANENQLKELNNHLDEKVKQRTIEIESLNERILLNNKLLKKINANLPAIIYFLNVKNKQINLINNNINQDTILPFETNKAIEFVDFIEYFSTISTKKITLSKFCNKAYNEEFTLQVNDRKLYVQNKSTAFEVDKKGNPVTYLGFITDVTQIKDTQNKLEQSQKIAHIGTWVWNIKSNDLYWTDEIYRMFEIEKKYFKPSYPLFLEKIYPEDRLLVENAVNDCLVNKTNYGIIHRIEPSPGIIKHVEEKGYVEYSDAGEPLLMIGTVQDITESRNIQLRLEESQKLAKLGTWELNLKTNEVYWSKEMYNIYDVNPTTFELTFDNLLKRVHPGDRDLVNNTPKIAIQSKQKCEVEYRIIDCKGGVKWVKDRGYAEYNLNGEPYRLLGALQDITQEKLLQDKLRSSYVTLENSLSAIFTNDLDGKIIHANNAAVSMWGYNNLNDMLNDKPYAHNYWHPEEVHKVDVCIQEVMKHGFYSPIEPYRAKKADGNIAFIKFNLSIIKDTNDIPVAMTGSFFDVTEEVKNKREIEENERKLNLLLGNIDEVVYGIEVSDEDLIPGKAFFLSGKSLEIIGYALKDLQAQPTLWYDSIHPDDYDIIVTSTIKAITQNTSVTREYRMFHRLHKEYYWYEDKITTYTNEQGQIVAYYGSIRNVSERKKLDLLLIENEKKYRLIYENALVGIFRTNIATQKPIDANNICIKMMGYDSKEDFINNFFASNHYANLEDRNYFIDKLKSDLFIENQEVLFKRKDGSLFWGNTSVKILVEEHIMEGVVIDVTLRKEYEEQLKKSLSEKDVLLKEIHHRVKNNLQVISSLLKLQQHKHSNPLLIETLAESRERIKAIALIHEKMYLSEDISTINFSEYLTNLTKSIYPIYKGKDVKLILDLEDYVTDINVAMPLGLACYEIISNAYKHAFIQSHSPELKIYLKIIEGYTQIEIIDNGKGFHVESIDMTQTLGWSLIKNLIKQAKGQLSIISEINKGSQFRINI